MSAQFTISDKANTVVGSSGTQLNTPTQPTVDCSLRQASPRRLSNEYNKICTTQKKLVKSGSVTCSVKLTDSPPTVTPTVDLVASTSDNTVTEPPHLALEGSVHWGAVGDFSGVQTPDPSLL